MAGSINKVTLVGNLGRDPEIRHTATGQKIAHLSVATSETWKDKSGERQERTEWHRVVIFNANLADFSERYLKKGSKVYVEGALQTRKFTDQSGQDRYTTEVVADRVEFLSNGERSGAPAGGQQYGGQSYGGGQGMTGGSDFGGIPEGFQSVSDDDIPF